MFVLIDRLQKKEESALREVIDVYSGYVKAIVVKILQPNQTAIEECINCTANKSSRFLHIRKEGTHFTTN